MRAILYKPLNKLFRNRKEQKRYFGTHQMYKMWNTHRDYFEIITNENSAANYEYIYKNATDIDRFKHKK